MGLPSTETPTPNVKQTVSDQLQGVLIGAAVTLLAGLLVHFREKARQQSEETRWYAQVFLQRKFDALARLHEALVDCRFSLGTDPAVRAEDPAAYLQSLQSKQFAVIRARAVTTIYLDEKQSDLIGKGVIAFVDVCYEISKRVGEWQRGQAEGRGGVFEWVTDKEWNQFFDGYKVATVCLRHLLSPKFPGSAPQGVDLNLLQPPTQPTT